MEREATSLTCSAGRLPAGGDSCREAGDAGSSVLHTHEEYGQIDPDVRELSALPLVPAGAAISRFSQQPAGQTRVVQQVRTAFRAVLVVLCAVATRPNDRIPTTAARAIRAIRRSFERFFISIPGTAYPNLHFHRGLYAVSVSRTITKFAGQGFRRARAHSGGQFWDAKFLLLFVRWSLLRKGNCELGFRALATSFGGGNPWESVSTFQRFSSICTRTEMTSLTCAGIRRPPYRIGIPPHHVPAVVARRAQRSRIF
jgi:hypothetical protein